MRCPSCGAQLPAQDLECARCSASVGWWVRDRQGQESGPYTFLEVQELVRQERVGPLDRVRIGLIGEWVAAPEVLSPSFQEVEPPAAPARLPPRGGAQPKPRHTGRPLLFVGLAVVLLCLGIGLVVVSSRRGVVADDPGQACLANLQKLAQGLRAYAADCGEVLPPWQNWGAAAYSKVREPGAFVCPAAPAEPGYAYNGTLSAYPLSGVVRPGRCVMLWDAGALGPHPGVLDAGAVPRHRGGDNFAFVDGHFAWRERSAYAQMDIDLQPWGQ